MISCLALRRSAIKKAAYSNGIVENRLPVQITPLLLVTHSLTVRMVGDVSINKLYSATIVAEPIRLQMSVNCMYVECNQIA